MAQVVTNMWQSIRSLLPSLDDYSQLPRTWRGDIFAGVTVGIVALPLALAFGVSSGVGAEAGLITAIIAGLVAAIFGGSNVQVSGPTGAMVVVLAPIVIDHGVGAVALLSLIAGIMVLAAGFLKLGRTVGYIPWPVIAGFTAGIACIIFAQQVPNAVGVEINDGYSTNSIVAAFQSFGDAAWPMMAKTLALVIITAGIMVIIGKLNSQLPSSFIAIGLVTAAAAVMDFGVPTIGELPAALPAPTMPHVTWNLVQQLAGPAVAVAALAAIESLLSARVASTMENTGPMNPDRELVGQGLASIASGFFGGMPATGAIARTAVNVRSGGRSRLASIIHALVLLGVVYLAATLVSQIPLAALSGVLMVTAVRMFDIDEAKVIIRATHPDAVTFFITWIITISVDLVVAVGIGMAVAAFFVLRSLSRVSGVHREEIAGKAESGDEKIAQFRIDGALFFGASERITERIQAHESLKVVVLRLSQLELIDATGAHVLTELVRQLEQRGITVLIKGIRDKHQLLLKRVGVLDSLQLPRTCPKDHHFEELEDAIIHAREHVAGLWS